VQNYPDPTLWYYYQGPVPHLVLPHAANDYLRSSDEVAQMVGAGVGRVILVEQPDAAWDANAIAQSTLGAHFALANQTKVAQWPLSLWLRAPNQLPMINLAYTDGLELASALITPTIQFPGGVVEIYLRWQGDSNESGKQEAVSLQLLNNGGQLVAQNDSPLTMASRATAPTAGYAILLPSTLAAGEYAVNVVVYDPGEAGAPRRLTAAGADSVTLGKITVRE
jgi:hypothetical protein